ncbi:hypothetical protein AAFC00_004584 [Neodothiora populina]|uniref:R3H-associated N-terminal domain-containing protein n=1 Tax=Neodothiora populina TaxID=2781224 RepID=A0ABR3P2H3_9PEZI
MAVFPPPSNSSGVDSTPAIDIEAWTVEQAAERLQATRISPLPPLRRVAIEIPLDEPARRNLLETRPAEVESTAYPVYKKEAVHTVYKRKEPVRRDSLKSREASLKGKEGSRRRQRWENDRLLNNPYAQPPLPSDWEVRPTYPVHNVPYFLAPLWDAEYKHKSSLSNKRSHRSEDPRAHGTLQDQAASRVPRELKAKLKKVEMRQGHAPRPRRRSPPLRRELGPEAARDGTRRSDRCRQRRRRDCLRRQERRHER